VETDKILNPAEEALNLFTQDGLMDYALDFTDILYRYDHFKHQLGKDRLKAIREDITELGKIVAQLFRRLLSKVELQASQMRMLRSRRELAADPRLILLSYLQVGRSYQRWIGLKVLNLSMDDMNDTTSFGFIQLLHRIYLHLQDLSNQPTAKTMAVGWHE
jgi:hypothetical protein